MSRIELLIEWIFQDPKLTHDIYLVSCTEDKDLAGSFVKALHRGKPNIKLKGLTDVGAKMDTWQHDVNIAMMSCSR